MGQHAVAGGKSPHDKKLVDHRHPSLCAEHADFQIAAAIAGAIVAGRNSVVAVDSLQSAGAGHAVSIQVVVGLKRLDRVVGALTVVTVHGAIVVLELLEALLQLLGQLAAVTLLEGARGLGGSRAVGLDGGGGVQLLKRRLIRHAGLAQAILLLEGLHRVDGLGAVLAVNVSGVVAQLLQALLQLLDLRALVALFQGTVGGRPS